jgi:hypothetical protein
MLQSLLPLLLLVNRTSSIILLQSAVIAQCSLSMNRSSKYSLVGMVISFASISLPMISLQVLPLMEHMLLQTWLPQLLSWTSTISICTFQHQQEGKQLPMQHYTCHFSQLTQLVFKALLHLHRMSRIEVNCYSLRICQSIFLPNQNTHS